MNKKIVLITILICTMFASFAHAGSTFSRIKTWSSGQTLTAGDLNAEFDNVLNNLDPSGIDDESGNATAMQATADPYPGAAISQPTSLQGEIQRLRYQIAAILGTTYWYQDAPYNLSNTQIANGTAASGTYIIPVVNSSGFDPSYIDSDLFTGAYWPSMRATLSGDQAVATTSPTKVNFNTESFDTNSNYDNATNYRFTPTSAGKYLVYGKTYLNNCDTGQFIIYIYKNGAVIGSVVDGTDVAYRTLQITTIVDMNGSSDYLELFIDAVSDSSYDVKASSSHGSELSISKIAK